MKEIPKNNLTLVDNIIKLDYKQLLQENKLIFFIRR
jgi:hypothetical protein